MSVTERRIDEGLHVGLAEHSSPPDEGAPRGGAGVDHPSELSVGLTEGDRDLVEREQLVHGGDGSSDLEVIIARAAREAVEAYKAEERARAASVRREYDRDRFQSDDSYREAARARLRAWKEKKRATDPGWVERENAREAARRRERYAADPAYRERAKARQRELRRTGHVNTARKREREQERFETDPSYRERRRAISRESARRRRAAAKEQAK